MCLQLIETKRGRKLTDSVNCIFRNQSFAQFPIRANSRPKVNLIYRISEPKPLSKLNNGPSKGLKSYFVRASEETFANQINLKNPKLVNDVTDEVIWSNFSVVLQHWYYEILLVNFFAGQFLGVKPGVDYKF